jgi:hypothetical protein
LKTHIVPKSDWKWWDLAERTAWAECPSVEIGVEGCAVDHWIGWGAYAYPVEGGDHVDGGVYPTIEQALDHLESAIRLREKGLPDN